MCAIARVRCDAEAGIPHSITATLSPGDGPLAGAGIPHSITATLSPGDGPLAGAGIPHSITATLSPGDGPLAGAGIPHSITATLSPGDGPIRQQSWLQQLYIKHINNAPNAQMNIVQRHQMRNNSTINIIPRAINQIT